MFNQKSASLLFHLVLYPNYFKTGIDTQPLNSGNAVQVKKYVFLRLC